MARPRQVSIVQFPPRVKGFIPLGYYAEETEPIQLDKEEFETIRLLDYENLSQEEAAEIMEVSRPTLTRMYERARKKIARALTESHKIVIEGGKAIFNGEWYECSSCNCHFNNPKKLEIIGCPVCSGTQITKLEE